MTPFADRVTSRLRRLAGGLPDQLRPAVEGLVERPGKRLRCSLVEACARYGTADPTRLERAGAIVELLHVASLLHDDVVDGSAVRRGAPAAHTVVGIEAALLAGLACFALAGTEAADLGAGASILVGRAVAGLSYGQLLDVERAFDTTLAVEDYLELVARKTADLFALCCELGAGEARVRAPVRAGLATFGTEIGVAFQVLDDCLDLEATGTDKPAGTDHLRGLFGAPTLYALRQPGAAALSELLLSSALDPTDLPRIRTEVDRLGGLVMARQLARARYDRALAALHPLGHPDGQAAVVATVDSIDRRLP